MVLSKGDKIHVIHRQLFEASARRHFAGTVEACDSGLARVTGYLFSMGAKSNQFERHDPLLRTHIVPLTSGLLIINILPGHLALDKLSYKHRAGNSILLSDCSDWNLDLSHL
jgi:hypothetical protein